jgi:hypothetical protein
MNHKPRAPLRVLLVTDGQTIPNWLCKCLADVAQSGAAKVELVLQAAPDGRGSDGLVQRARHILFQLYQSLDRRVFRRLPDALAPIPLRSALPGCRVADRADSPDEPFDVVLDPFSLVADGCLTARSRYGVWSTTVGQSGDPRTQSTPAFWEVIEGRPSTETRVWVRRQGGEKQASLYAAATPTDRRSVSRCKNDIYWRIAAALARKIERLWEDPEGFLGRLPGAAPFEVASSPSVAPDNLQMLRACTLLLRRYVSDKWTRTLYRDQWALAYQHGSGGQMVRDAVHKVIPPMDRFWADPFPIRVGNDYYIFHEELRFSSGKGTIVLSVVDDKPSMARPIPILEKDYHLSYPFVFEWDGQLFMIPETGSRHQVELYRCVRFPAQWKLERVLLSGVTALDPTPAFLFGRWWLFANVPAYGATGTNDELHLFHADSLLGAWSPHRNNPIKSDVRSARPAGRIFERNGQFHRPAQDCSTRYGYAVSINRILQLSPDAYEEVEVERVLPDWEPRLAGVHTLNVAGDMTVIDFVVRRRKF